MRKLLLTALPAVFFLMSLSGCYTKLGTPRPSTGETTREHYYYDDSADYPDFPYYSGGGWQGPYLYAYPYINYGYFYNPWWYDSWYGSDEGNNDRRYNKSARSRGHQIDSPPAPFPGYTPPPSLPPADNTLVTDPPPQSDPPVAGDDNKDNFGSAPKKQTRSRR